MLHIILRLAIRLNKKQKNRLMKRLADAVIGEVGRPGRIIIKELSDEGRVDIELIRPDDRETFFEDMIRSYARD